ncbi:DUF4491 family protein [Anaerocolumna sp. MB42-C2]|uniref:DUF4491 family protein n=1 Tax=Anaerocolumna sp. MB42-C2 TaxID=3070997 RepID=UPI0027E00A09|nr:DUF4491 family protein [Anaerocolumna sp. MB42-C2]WMJ86630.1 DUF4491 family protein [Anaerocolumna sp. MB42-C2]
MNLQGIIIGIVTFLIIGIFHPIVIKFEYYFGKKVWPIFLIVGIIGVFLSLFINSVMLSSIAGVFGFSSLWAIHEIIEQEERVKKGWFPRNPKKCEVDELNK